MTYQEKSEINLNYTYTKNWIFIIRKMARNDIIAPDRNKYRYIPEHS